jgi:hypothetical protein
MNILRGGGRRKRRNWSSAIYPRDHLIEKCIESQASNKFYLLVSSSGF